MRTIAEINERIKRGEAVVVTADEMTSLVSTEGAKAAARKVDVVTTGTFGAMCSSGAFLNFGHARPRMRMSRVWLNGVPACAGLAAVDCYIGATELREDDRANQPFPGEFRYGGAHVIQDLIDRRPVQLRATSYGTHCYPRREIETWISLDTLNQAYLYNPRNAYQNYNVATNLSDRTLYTYLGILKPRMGNVSYSSAGQLSPLLNDPHLRTIGIGTRIFLGGGIGYVAWEGTQHSPGSARNERGVPMGGAATLAVAGELRGMDSRYLRGVSLVGYGTSLAVGLGIPIPILDEDLAAATGIGDADIQAPVVDYSGAYPTRQPDVIAYVNYAELKSGRVRLNGVDVPASPMSSYPRACEIARKLKEWIARGQFLLTEPVAPLPGPQEAIPFRPLEDRVSPQ